MALADETPPKRPGPDADGQITSSFPADGRSRGLDDSVDSAADADTWVDQWSKLFDDDDGDDASAIDDDGDDASATDDVAVVSYGTATDNAPVIDAPVIDDAPAVPDEPAAPATHDGFDDATVIEPTAGAQTADGIVDERSIEQPAADRYPVTREPPTEELPGPAPLRPPPDERSAPGDQVPGNPDLRLTFKPEQPDGDAAEMLAWQKAQERSKRRAKLHSNQRKAQVMQRQRPTAEAGIRVEDGSAGDHVPLDYPRTSSGQGSTAADGGRTLKFALAAGAAVATVVVLVGVVTSGFGLISRGQDSEAVVGPTTGDEVAGPGLEVGAEVASGGISELALSTVQLVGLNDDLEPECAGSGVIVRSDGTILTNAHVVRSEGACQFSTIGVGVTINSAEPAELLYRAEVLVVDDTLDLAVLRIAGLLDSEDDRSLPDSFPQAPLGDSDTVELGDNVRILGYPVIGGETITLTTGTVSGFTSQAGIGSNGLIKTDATISAGNSGGLAIDPDGRVIGIPTKARASESGPAIDCRALNDTNLDGAVDDLDNCVPVGGFLNGVRPINLALPLLEQAIDATPIGPVAGGEPDEPTFDYSQVVFDNPRFSLGQENNQPVSVVETAVAGTAELCFFVDWSGIPVGTEWDGVWFVNGELDPEVGFTDEPWTIEEEAFWLCAMEENQEGLPVGVYEVGLFIEDELMFVEGIELTEEPVEVVPVTWINDTEGEICQLSINPFSESGQVGLNELAEGVTIPSGRSVTTDLPLGRVVVEAYNCEGEPVADAFAGLEVEGEANFLIGL